jgi:biopolymer transport protein ExbD
MPLKTDTIEEPNLNLTPMIDIVFLLIIFFMVGTRFAEMERQYDIELPSVSQAQPLTTLPDDITINVRRSGEIVVNGTPKTLDELKSDLIAASDNYQDQAVLVRGEGQGPYQHVIDVVAACKEAKIRVISLAYRMEDKGKP